MQEDRTVSDIAEENFETGEGFYENGNYEEALFYYSLSAVQGNTIARYRLGNCYQNGVGVERNDQEAARHYKLSLDQGYAKAQEQLDILSVRFVQQYGKKHMMLSKSKIEAEENFKTGREFYVCKIYKKAVTYYQLSADQGHAAAQCYLGSCYQLGLGVEQSYNEAVKYFKLSAVQGNVVAQTILGSCYQLGLGVEQNYTEAVKYYQLSAGQKNANAQFALGILYFEGLGVEQNWNEGLKYFKLSAAQGDADAQFNLGYCYKKGLGVEQNYNEAVKYFTLSAIQGNAVAQKHLNKLSQDLFVAVQTNDLETAEKLLFAGVAIMDKTVLHCAVENKNPQMAELLLCYGEDVDGRNQKGIVSRDLNPDLFDVVMRSMKAKLEKAWLFVFHFTNHFEIPQDVTKIILLTLLQASFPIQNNPIGQCKMIIEQESKHKAAEFVRSAKEFFENYNSFFSIQFLYSKESKDILKSFEGIIFSKAYSDVEKESFAKEPIDNFLRQFSVEEDVGRRKEKLESEYKIIDNLLKFKLIDLDTLEKEYKIRPLIDAVIAGSAPSKSSASPSSSLSSSFTGFMSEVSSFFSSKDEKDTVQELDMSRHYNNL